VQEVVNLQDNESFLKITIAKWLTPKGNSISEVGLEPDVKVEISEDDLKNQKDPQLQKALEIIRNLK
jgi:carboxyl-terminal processing protease